MGHFDKKLMAAIGEQASAMAKVHSKCTAAQGCLNLIEIKTS